MKTFPHRVPDLSQTTIPPATLRQQWLRGLRICFFGYFAALLVSLPFVLVAKGLGGTVGSYIAAPLVLLAAPVLLYRVFHLLGFSLQPLDGRKENESDGAE